MSGAWLDNVIISHHTINFCLCSVRGVSGLEVRRPAFQSGRSPIPTVAQIRSVFSSSWVESAFLFVKSEHLIETLKRQ